MLWRLWRAFVGVASYEGQRREKKPVSSHVLRRKIIETLHLTRCWEQTLSTCSGVSSCRQCPAVPRRKNFSWVGGFSLKPR